MSDHYITRPSTQLLALLNCTIEVRYDPTFFNLDLVRCLMAGRFDYVKYSEENASLQNNFKDMVQTMEWHINQLPQGRASALAITKLEECYMWIGKAIRDKQVAEGGDSTDQPQRG